jgi:hypothetical protein
MVGPDMVQHPVAQGETFTRTGFNSSTRVTVL